MFSKDRTERLKLQARRLDEAKRMTNAEGGDKPSIGMGSPEKAESISTSIEVQTGNSVEVLSVRDERIPVMSNWTQQKAKITQVSKPKVRSLR